MKKIMVYVENYDYGGLEKFLYDFVLHSEKSYLKVFINDDNERVKEFLKKENIDFTGVKIAKNLMYIEKYNKLIIFILKVIRKFFALKYWSIVYNYFLLKKEFSKYQKEYPNLFIINGGYPAASSARVAVLAAKKVGIKNVVMSVLSYPQNYVKKNVFTVIEKKLDREISKKINIIQPNSNQIKKGLIEEFGFNGDKIKTVYTGIEIRENFYRLSTLDVKGTVYKKEKNDVWIGMIGFLGWPKSQEIIIKAMKLLEEESLQFKCIIVGNGPNYDKLKKLIEDLRLENSVFLLGKYEGDIEKIYSFIDLCVFSSVHEGLPYAISEAMANKLPIISTNVGGIEEQIDNGENGYLIEKENIEQLREKLLFLCENKSKWEDLGEKAHIKAKEKFSIETMVRELDKLFI